MSLLPFVLNTAKNTTDDPGSKYFLPVILANIKGNNSQGKLLPLEEKRWDIGAVGGVPGQTITTAFANNWMTYLEKVEGMSLDGQEAIASPGSPNPKLTLGGVDNKLIQIIGLQNAYVDTVNVVNQTKTQYQLSLTLQFSYWNKSNGQPDLPQMMLKAPYSMQQKLCLANQGEATCNGNASTDINGGGEAGVNINNAYVDADVTLAVSGSDNSRALSVTVTKITLRGKNKDTTPDLDVVELTIDANVSSFLRGIWEDSARKAITSPDGQQGIFTQVGNSLNSENNLTSLSSTMTTQLGLLVDDLFGKVTGKLPSDKGQDADNDVDQYIFDRIRYALNSQDSNWYVAKVLCNLSNPSIDPYSIDKIDLPDLPVEGLTFKKVSLTQVQINGLTNAEAPADSMVLYPDKMTMVGALGVLDPVPKIKCKKGAIPAPPSTITSKFSATAEGVKLDADVKVTIKKANLNMDTSASGADVDHLVITMNSMTVSLADLSNMNIDVDIQSAFKSLINAVINKPKFKTMILDKVNGALADNLAKIGTAITGYAKDIIKSQIS